MTVLDIPNSPADLLKRQAHRPLVVVWMELYHTSPRLFFTAHLGFQRPSKHLGIVPQEFTLTEAQALIKTLTYEFPNVRFGHCTKGDTRL
jgi:hypothetical protein